MRHAQYGSRRRWIPLIDGFQRVDEAERDLLRAFREVVVDDLVDQTQWSIIDQYDTKDSKPLRSADRDDYS